MKRTAPVAATCVLLLAASACSHDDEPASKATTSTRPEKPSAAAEPTKAGTPDVKPLGASVRTDGAADPIEGNGGGVLQITPTSVIYMKSTGYDEPENGQFLVVTVKEKAMTAAPASEEAPMGGGGWSYIAPDGQAVSTLTGNATNVVPDGFEGGGAIDPGTYQWKSTVFDIGLKQAGGTLSYKDGAGEVYRWKTPASTTGPEASKVEASLK
ncbi:hypothetical protein [Streptomyces sp. SPB074]|uniref:hypothetical protein n=1 Tax=Streptomyces sp. (strain SPB074) TaxID=465543 RepID=UPI001319C86C|nr:hypothetical protein [Streptomyces sp. SPB074]